MQVIRQLHDTVNMVHMAMVHMDLDSVSVQLPVLLREIYKVVERKR